MNNSDSAVYIPIEVFQNMGVWGLDGTPLHIECGKVLDTLELFINTNNKEFLNIQKVEIILENDEMLSLSENIKSAKLSSNYYENEDGSLDVKARLIQNRLIHTLHEHRPSLRLEFSKKLSIKEVRVFNRADIYGLRSRFLSIDGLNGNSKLFSFRNVDEKLINCLYAQLVEILQANNKTIKLPENADSAASYIRSLVADAIDSGLSISGELIESLLPVSAPVPRLDRLSAMYLSDYIENKLEGKNCFGTKQLSEFRSILIDDVSIDTLSRYSSEYISRKKGEPKKVVIAKHRVHYDSLLSKRDLHLDFLDEVFNVLKEFNGTPFIAYGTLLGAYRDGGFLPADDDLDICLYYPSVTSHNDKENVKRDLVEFLLSRKFSATIQKGCPHITVRSNTDSVDVDIFFVWDTDNSEKVNAVMEQLKTRDINRDMLLPTSDIELYGRSYPAPAKAAEFLEDRYGKGWYRSNPYDEWSWKLIQRAYFDDTSLSKLYDHRESTRSQRSARSKTQLIAWSQCVSRVDIPPANSIPMLLQAIDYDYDVVELDIRCSKDGEVILAHDDYIKNKDGDSIYLSKSDLREIQSFKVGNYGAENIYLSTLDEALPYLKDRKVLLDARFSASDYEKLRGCVDKVGFDRSKILFCVYSVDQIPALMRYFPESLYFWKFYTQAWEIDELALKQVRQYGVDGVMYMYPYYDEDITDSLYRIRNNDLQSMCFIHGSDWNPPHSTGLSPRVTNRSKDIYEASLNKMIALGIEYVTSIECREKLQTS